jgi:hydrogenase nickel incorporation protein HypA/HybF
MMLAVASASSIRRVRGNVNRKQAGVIRFSGEPFLLHLNRVADIIPPAGSTSTLPPGGKKSAYLLPVESPDQGIKKNAFTEERDMHELSVIDSILKVVLKHAASNEVEKVVAVGLRIGKLSDLVDEWMQHYFDYLSKDTLAEGAILKIERSPVIFQCKACTKDFPVEIMEIRKVACPACGSEDVSLISGREFYIKNIEVI